MFFSRLSRLALVFGLVYTFLWVMAAAPEPAQAQQPVEVTTLLPVKDNTLYQDNEGDVSNGAGQHLFVGRTNGNRIRRALIAFDIAGSIPAGSTILTATLVLNMSRSSQAGPENLALHVAMGNWGEGSSDASGEEGSGTAATTGDATWLHASFSGVNWTNPGGDFVPAPSATTLVNVAIGNYQWQSTQMRDDVQIWLENPTIDQGWIIIGDEGSAGTAKRFDTREHPTPANRPQLIIQYTPPTPSAPEDVTIAGAAAGLTGITYNFTATVSPLTTTLPITYSWTATDQTAVNHPGSNSLEDVVSFNWSTAGVKTVMVTAENSAGTVTDSLTITITEAQIPSVAVETVTITGSPVAQQYTPIGFDVTAGPISTTLPITYTVVADEQLPESFGKGLNFPLTYVWGTTGTKMITVTADNGLGTATDTFTITVEAPAGVNGVVTPLKDNTLYEDNEGDISNGMGQYFFVGNTNSSATRRGVIAFNITDTIPAGATIVTATVVLHLSRNAGGADAITLHTLTADWGEGASDAPDNEGTGTLAELGDATWVHSFYTDTMWSTAGGDFVSTASATQTVSAEDAYYMWSSSALAADVQGWLDNPSSNYGWLVMGNESTGSTAKRFDSRHHPTPAYRPVLLVSYTIDGEETTLYLPIILR